MCESPSYHRRDPPKHMLSGTVLEKVNTINKKMLRLTLYHCFGLSMLLSPVIVDYGGIMSIKRKTSLVTKFCWTVATFP